MQKLATNLETTSGEPQGDATTTAGSQRGGLLANYAPALIPYLILVSTGLWGIDYGFHVDERSKHLKYLAQMVETCTLIPENYMYPGVIYWIGLGALTPDAAAVLLDKPDGWRSDHLAAIVDTDEFQIRARAAALIIASLASVWVYALVFLWRRSRIEALLASCFLACSWEYAYHARFYATDSLMAQFAALSLLCVVYGYLQRSKSWLLAAAIVAGVATGTKYPAGIGLLPVLLACFWLRDRTTFLASLKSIAQPILAFGIAYLVTTPGTILRPTYFAHWVHYVMGVYKEGWYNYTVDGPGDHCWKLAIYFSRVFFSFYQPLALAAFVFSVLGTLFVLRKDGRAGLLFLVLPVAYFVYFSTRNAMLVRNMLVIGPPLAILAARGVIWLVELLRHSLNERKKPTTANLVTWGIAVPVAGLLLINTAWLAYAADNVTKRVGKGGLANPTSYGILMRGQHEYYLHDAARYIESIQPQSVALSPQVRRAMLKLELITAETPVVDPSQADYILFFHREGIHRRSWPTHLPRLFAKQFGPLERNMNYYPSHQGDDRPLLIRRELAEELGQIEALWRKTE